MTVHQEKFIIINQLDALISQIYLGMKLYMFWTVPLSIIRSLSLYTQQWYMSYRCANSLQAGSVWNWVPSWSCSQAVSKPVWHIPLLCLQWKTPDDGQRNCPKHVEFHSKNKFEKLVYLVGFIIRNLTRFTVTWTSNCNRTWTVPFLTYGNYLLFQNNKQSQVTPTAYRI